MVLICDDLRIPAHKTILAAASPYFKAMFSGNLIWFVVYIHNRFSNIGHFSDAQKQEIHFNELDSSCFKAVIEFVYTAKISLNLENVQKIMPVACFLQISMAEMMCAQHMIDNLDGDNCLEFKLFASNYYCDNIYTDQSLDYK